MINKLTIVGSNLVIEPQGIYQVLSLTKQIEISLSNISSVTIDTDVFDEEKGIRFPGTTLPNVWCGTYILDGEQTFWNVTRNGVPVVFYLNNEKFSRLVLGVDNAGEWINLLSNAIY